MVIINQIRKAYTPSIVLRRKIWQLIVWILSCSMARR